MQFGQIVKELLNRNNSVWIPHFGLLRYEEGSSKLIFDRVSNGSEDALIAQLSQRNNLSPIEARTMLYNQVSLIKETIASNGKYALNGIGEIIEFDNSYQILEEKKSLFPSDFFGMSSFDFTENKTSTDFYSEAEKMKVEETPVAEQKATITPELVQEEKKVIVEEVISEPPIRSDLDSFIEESKQKREEVESTPKEEAPSLFSDLFAKVKKTTKKKKEEPTREESLFNAIMEEEHRVEEVAVLEEESVPEEIIVQEAPVEEIEEKEEIAPLEIVEEAETIEEPIEEEVTTEVEEILPEIIEEPEEPTEIVRRNIGRANYDEGYYEHLVTSKSSKSEGIRLGRVLPIVAALAILAFFIPWIVASFQGKYFLGMNPLFDSNKKSDTKKITKTAPILDTAKRDSLAMAKMDSTPISNNKDTLAKVIPPAPAKTAAAAAPTKQNTTTSVSPVVEKPKSGIASKPSITKTQNENTPPKTTAGVNSPKKQTKKSEVANATAVKDSTKKTAEVVSIDKKGTAASKAVIGKPYATANYTKGNTYLNFGSFKIPKNAVKLKRDLNKLGVETDVINVDGTYKVVVSYTNKEKATAAAKDYPNTTVFE